MPTEMLTRPERPLPRPAPVTSEDDGLHAATQRQVKRVRRLKINAAAWGVGTIALTATSVAHEWQANGAFERFAHEGNPGDWNPTLWAVAVLVWTLVVGVMALRVHFERPATAADVDYEVARTKGGTAHESGVALRRRARARLDRLGQLRFHVAAWLLGMITLTPVNALIEWQDNGGFKRFSGNSQPGSWEPWILIVGGVWALAIVVFFALPVYLDRRRSAADARDLTRLHPSR